MQILNNVTVSDQYTQAATIENVLNSNGGYFLISNNDVFMQMQYNIQGQLHWTKEIHVPTGSGQIFPNTAGVRFRNFIAGSAALLSAAISENREPSISIGASGVANVGSVATSELAYQEFTSPVSITATTEGTAQVVVTSPSVTYAALQTVIVQFYSPTVFNPGSADIRMILYDVTAAAVLGQIARVNTNGATIINVPVNVARRITPGAGARIYSIRAWVSAGTGTVSAGLGGSGSVDMPGYIRIVGA